MGIGILRLEREGVGVWYLIFCNCFFCLFVCESVVLFIWLFGFVCCFYFVIKLV